MFIVLTSNLIFYCLHREYNGLLSSGNKCRMAHLGGMWPHSLIHVFVHHGCLPFTPSVHWNIINILMKDPDFSYGDDKRKWMSFLLVRKPLSIATAWLSMVQVFSVTDILQSVLKTWLLPSNSNKIEWKGCLIAYIFFWKPNGRLKLIWNI